MVEKVLIIRQVQDIETWAKIRNLAWFCNKELFDKIERLTYDLLEEKPGQIKFKEVKDDRGDAKRNGILSNM